MTNGEPSVGFTVKEMFAEVDKKLEYIIAQLTTKASTSDMDTLSNAVGELEQRVSELESEVKTFKRLAALIGSAGAALVAFLQLRGGL